MPATRVHGSKFSGVLDVPDGTEPFATNISAGLRFVRMTGIRPVGRTTYGYIVAVRDGRAPNVGPVAVTITPAHTTVLQAGKVVSLFSAASLAALIVWPLRRARPGRKRSGRAVGVEPSST